LEYQNPLQSVVNLFAVENIDSVRIYNLFGQNLLDKNISNTKGTIDISGIASGT